MAGKPAGVSAPRIAVYGAGGHGKVVADIAQSAGREVVVFIDDDPQRSGTSVAGIRVASWEEFLRMRGEAGEVELALGIGENGVRQRCAEKARTAQVPLATLVHPTAVVARSASLGEGTVVMAGAIVNPAASVGHGAVVNTGSIVEHDCRLGDFVFLSPGAVLGGEAVLGASCHVGLGAVVLPRRRVGAGSRVGAGAAVVHDVPDGETWVGVPAASLPRR